MLRLSQNRLIVLSSIFLTLFYNYKFFKELILTYGFITSNIFYFLSVTVVLTLLIIFLLTLFSSKYTTKPILITIFTISAFTAYFMDSYSIVIDSEMIRNSLQTSLLGQLKCILWYSLYVPFANLSLSNNETKNVARFSTKIT